MSGVPQDRAELPRRKVLFVAEAVTLAHVARPLALARGLDQGRFEVAVASGPAYRDLWRDVPWPVRAIDSVAPAQFLEALAAGRPLYDVATLRRYVAEDLDVLREVAPDVVVGDFRLSLSVSARVAGVPYLAITNAYWSPYARQRFPLPDLPMVKALGLPLARAAFAAARPLAFALHTRPLDRVRRDYGLPPLGPDLRRTYTDADRTLYADVPEMIPTPGAPPTHHYLGPVLWSPDADLPPWWYDLVPGAPLVYVTLGSSGPARLLPVVLDALADLPVTALVATLGRPLPGPAPANALTADYLPGLAAAARARLVICNGGSPSTHQSLAAGVPVLGVASNMDQHLNMAAVQRLGAGELVRSDRASAGAIRAAAASILGDPRYRDNARRLAGIFSRYAPLARFQTIVESLPHRAR